MAGGVPHRQHGRERLQNESTLARKGPGAQGSRAASLLRLQRGAGNAAVTRLLQRQPKGGGGKPDFEQEFVIGTDVSVDFAQKAQTAAKGKVGDAQIAGLRKQALDEDATISDAERMFMVALSVPANVKKVAEARMANGTKLTLSFPRTADTAKEVRRIADFGRQSLSADVKAASAEVDAASFWDFGDMWQAVMKRDKAARAQIFKLAGPLKSKAQGILDYAQAEPKGPLSVEILAAMLAAGSDSTPDDMVLAGAAFVIARAAGNPMADEILSGKVKVDAQKPPKGEGGGYVFMSQRLAAHLKGDTLYLDPGLDITDIGHRATVIHELEHALDDVKFGKDGGVDVPAAEEELRAYRAEARYVLAQLIAMTADDRKKAVKKVAATWGERATAVFLLESRADRSRLEPLVKQINTAAVKGRQAANIDAWAEHTDDNLKELALELVIAKSGQLSVDKTFRMDKRGGESLLDAALRGP